MQTTLSVEGMTCTNCVRHVTEALLKVPGVTAAVVDLPAESAIVSADREIPKSELAAALAAEGYSLR